MALSQIEIENLKSFPGLSKAGIDPVMPPNLLADVDSQRPFETEFAYRIAAGRGLSFAFVYGYVTDAFLGKFDGIRQLGIQQELVANLWIPCRMCYPKAYIPDIAILK